MAAASTACDAVRTFSADCRVCAAAPVTSPSTDTTTFAPSEALATLCEISPVAALCSSTAAETAVAQLSISCIRPEMRLMADTALEVAACTAMISLEISSVALAVCTASDLTSEATTAIAGFAGAGRFDGGIECQKVGLPSDGADQFDNVADFLRGLRQRGDLMIGALRFADCRAYDLRRLGQLAADFVDRAGQFIGGDSGGFHIRRSFIRGCYGAVGAIRGLPGIAEQGGGRGPHRLGTFGHGLQVVLDLAPECGNCLVDHGAPLLLLLHRHPLAFRVSPLGDVLMRRHPAAIGHWPV